MRELENAFTLKLESSAAGLTGEEEESRHTDPEERLSEEVRLGSSGSRALEGDMDVQTRLCCALRPVGKGWV